MRKAAFYLMFHLMFWLGISATLLVNPVQARESDPRVQLLLRQAQEAKLMLETQKAIDIYDKIIEIRPKKARYYSDRADLHEKLNQFPEALKDFSRAIELDPTSAGMLRDRANIYWKLNKHDEALKDFTAAIKLDPTNGGAYKRRARIYRKLGRYKEAIADCKMAISKSVQEEDDMYLILGFSLMQTGQYQNALNAYTEMIEKFPDLSGGYYGRAQAYEKLGKKALAEKDLKKGRAADANLDPNVLDGRMRR